MADKSSDGSKKPDVEVKPGTENVKKLYKKMLDKEGRKYSKVKSFFPKPACSQDS
jgi:hypothetical protein